MLVKARNPYLYPSFELPSGTVTIRTNLITTPDLSDATTGWTFDGSPTQTATATGRRFVLTVALAASSGAVVRQANLAPASAGDLASDIFGVTNHGASAIEMRAASWPHNGTSNLATIYGPNVTIPSGEFRLLAMPASALPTGTTNVRAALVVGDSALPIGTDFEVHDGSALEIGVTCDRLISGSFAPVGDFDFAFTDTANASTSIMRAKGLPGLSPSNAIGFQSQEWAEEGDSSILISPNSANAASFVDLTTVAVVPGEQYTMIAVGHLEAPLTGTLDTHARKIAARFYQGSEILRSDAIPNIAGTHEVRFVLTVPAGRTILTPRLYNGASIGNGDIWWDILTIVPGTYTGPPFTGSTATDLPWRYGWEDAENASASLRYLDLAPVAAAVDIYGSFRRLVTEITITPTSGDPFQVDMQAGSVKADSGLFQRRTAPLTLRVTSAEANLINTPGTTVSIQHGHRDGNTDVLHPVFTGEPIRASRDLGDGRISLTCGDLAVWLDRCRFLTPWAAPIGPRLDAIETLITDARPGTTVLDQSTAAGAIAAVAVWDESRVDAIRELAVDANVETFFDPSGRYILRDPRTLASEPVWTIRPGDGGTLTAASRTTPLDRLYNTVVARPSATDGSQTWTQQVAQVTDTSHPRHPSKIGVVPFFLTLPTATTAEAAMSAAQTRLQKALGTSETLTLTLIGNPTLEAGDVIRAITPTINDEPGDSVTHFIDSFTLDFVTGGMGMQTRSADG